MALLEPEVTWASCSRLWSNAEYLSVPMISRCISLRSLYLGSQSQVKLFYRGTPEWYGPTPSSTFFSSTNCLFKNSEFQHSPSKQGRSTCTFLWSNQISLGPCFSCTSANERIKWCPVTATVTFCVSEWQFYNFGLMQDTLNFRLHFPIDPKEPHLDFP